MTDKDEQNDEILALNSIYEEKDFLNFDDQTRKGIFYAKVNASQKFKLNFINEKQILIVENLPPFILNFEFPNDYPSINAPKFTLKCRWLSRENISKLCKKLDDIWEKNCNCPVLFTWIYFLIDESLEYLQIDLQEIVINTQEFSNKNLNENIDERAIIEPCSIRLIQDYDRDQNELKFNSAYFQCNVCFTEKPGYECLKFLPCEHIYCNECMKSYFEIQIKDGNVNHLTCPYDKCESQALPLQVLRLLDEASYKKYEYLLLRNSLNNMDDVIYCPRLHCQNPVIPDENLAQCAVCQYVFCSLCRQGFHGIEPCKLLNNDLQKICNQYRSGDTDVRNKLEKRYGAKRLKNALEEVDSMSLIEQTSKQCPKCKSWMQKLDGCNKMTCMKCRAYFCWLCLNLLSKVDPYSHFNEPNVGCFNKLFEGIEIHDNEDDRAHINRNNQANNVQNMNNNAQVNVNVDDYDAAWILQHFNENYYDDDDDFEDEDDDDDDE